MRLIDADALKMRLDDLEASGGHTYYRKGMDDTLHYFMPKIIEDAPTIDPQELRPTGRWEDGRCSNCKEEASSTSWDEPIYDYDWEENLRYSHTETHTEYLLTTYCPNCGAKMDGG